MSQSLCVHCGVVHEDGTHDVVACCLFGHQGEIIKATNTCVCGSDELFVTDGREPHAYCTECHAPAASWDIDTANVEV